MTDNENPQHADLAESARFAWRIAPRTCRVDPGTGESCATTHAAWQYLRLLGIVGTIEYRAAFYLRALTELAPRGEPLRVLVSGAADQAMLAFVLSALGNRQPKIAVTVADWCETPLAVNRRHAERNGLTIETAQCDILEYQPAAAFDAICTDSFFGRFPAAARPALAAKWRSLLRAGGKLITANALRPASAPEKIVFSAEQVQALARVTARAAAEFPHELPLSPDELARLAEAHARHHVTYTLRSSAEIRVLLENAGFDVQALDTLVVNAAGNDNPAAPSVKRRDVTFLTVVAMRPF